MPQLIIPFDVKGIYLSNNETITEPSADFSKVSYFDKKKESVINPSMPYISENLVSQPFDNQKMILEKGVHLHFILPEVLRSDKMVDEKYELPPIPNRWLVTKNGTDQYIVESDYLFPEYSNLKNKVTIPIPWDKLKEKDLNVPFRYMGRQYRIGQQEDITGEGYWQDIMGTHLTAEGYGEPSFVGFLPNCKDILTFHDPNPAAGDTYEIWGWYDLADNSIDQLFENIESQAQEQLKINEIVTKAISAAKDGNDTQLKEVLSTDEEKLIILEELSLGYVTVQKIKTAPNTLSDREKEDIKELLKVLPENDFNKTKEIIQKELLEKTWNITLNKTDGYSTTQNDIYLYSKVKIDNLKDIKSQTANNKYDIAIGNSGTEAVSAFVAQKLKDNKGLNEVSKLDIENILEAVQFDSLNGDGVDIGSKFIAARHQKTFKNIKGGIKYLCDFEITPNSNETAEEISTFKKILKEGLSTQVSELKQKLYEINQLQTAYDKSILNIQSKRHQLFADWYKYMIAAHPSYMQEKDYPKADDILRYIYGHTVEEINELIFETGFLKVSAETSMPSALSGVKNLPQSLAHEILKKFEVFNALLVKLNANIVIEIKSKLAALAKARVAYKVASDAVKAIQYDEKTTSDSEKLKYLEAVAIHSREKETLDLLTSFGKLEGKKVEYTLNTNNAQRYYEANEPVILFAKKGAEESVFTTDKSIHSIDNLSGGIEVLGKSLPKAISIEATSLKYSNNLLLLEWEVNYRPIDDPSIEGKYEEDFIYNNFDIKPDTPDFIPIKEDIKGNNKEVKLSSYTRRYTGVTYVSGNKNELLEHKLESIETEDQNHRAVFDKTKALLKEHSCLTQTLGGFNQALLMRKQTMQLEVADPIAFDDYKPLIERIRSFVGDSRDSAPEPKHYFNPIRGGALEISRLKLINTFGQATTVYDSKNSKQKITPAETIRLPEELVLPTKFSNDRGKLLYLPPRFTQPARMNVNWVGADWMPDEKVADDFNPNPICGWIAPNFLENNFFIFDQKGGYLGSIGVINDEVKLFPKPGDNAFYIRDIKNRHLRNFVKYFTDNSLGVDLKYLFGEFTLGIEDSLDYIEPQNYAQFPALSLLVGQPLALVRASFSLELMEDYAVNQDWNIFKKDILKTRREKRETYDFEKVNVPIRIGDYDLLNDGVVGFWYKDIGYVDVEEGKEKISTVRPNPYTINLEDALYMPLFKKEKVSKQAIVSKEDLKKGRGSFLIEQNLEEKAQVIPILMDPRGEMTISAGILPVKRISIPPEYYKEVLDKIQYHFLASPIITPFDQLQMPLLNYSNTQWNWVSVDRDRNSGLMINEIPVAPSMTKHRVEKLFLEKILPQMAKNCWNVIKNTPWIITKGVNDTGNNIFLIGNLNENIPLSGGFERQKENIKIVLKSLSEDDDGEVITAAIFQSYYIEEIGSKEAIWEMLKEANWLNPMSEVTYRATINYSIKTRKSLPDYIDAEMLNDVFNNFFEGIGQTDVNPQYGQMAIREGWLKMTY
jgi:hypothetical protein